MTKKDYELIAKIFSKNIHTDNARELRHNVPVVAKAMSMQFADVLQRENPKFDKVKFLQACGINDPLTAQVATRYKD